MNVISKNRQFGNAAGLQAAIDRLREIGAIEVSASAAIGKSAHFARRRWVSLQHNEPIFGYVCAAIFFSLGLVAAAWL